MSYATASLEGSAATEPREKKAYVYPHSNHLKIGFVGKLPTCTHHHAVLPSTRPVLSGATQTVLCCALLCVATALSSRHPITHTTPPHQPQLLGKPNSGKSSLYNLYATKSGGSIAETEDFLFCTIDPSITTYTAEDNRYDWLYSTFNCRRGRRLHATFVDTAGLVKGSFLENTAVDFEASREQLKHVDVLVHVVRMFKDDGVARYDQAEDPIADIKVRGR